jgi:hypothetical protein
VDLNNKRRAPKDLSGTDVYSPLNSTRVAYHVVDTTLTPSRTRSDTEIPRSLFSRLGNSSRASRVLGCALSDPSRAAGQRRVFRCWKWVPRRCRSTLRHSDLHAQQLIQPPTLVNAMICRVFLSCDKACRTLLFFQAPVHTTVHLHASIWLDNDEILGFVLIIRALVG